MFGTAPTIEGIDPMLQTSASDIRYGLKSISSASTDFNHLRSIFSDNLLLTSICLVILDTPLISYIGIAIYILGGLITLTSRIQLGRYGDGTIAIKDEHELMTNGVYHYVRNPLYFGALLGRLGLALSFRGYIIGFLMILGFLILFSKRIEIEEAELEEKFGNSFRFYKERTKKLIPYIW